MKTIIILILIYIAYRIIKRTFYRIPHPAERTHEAGSEGEAVSQEEMVRDHECGTYVPVSNALTADVQGEIMYFCSRECREKYLASHGG